jgi:hypothetical protein
MKSRLLYRPANLVHFVELKLVNIEILFYFCTLKNFSLI